VISCIHNYESSIYLDNAKQAKSILKKIFFYREGFLLKKIENKIKNKASDIWALNTNDLKPFSGKGTVFIPYSFQSIITRNENDYSYDIGILGMWTWKPNYEAIIWFLKEVVPLLDKNIKIAIGGKGLPESFNFRENVLPLGFIPDAHIFFSQCRMIAIPSLHDIGIQIKSIDALSLGIPVVGTDIAFRNIEPLPEYAFAAKTCIDFANHICSILKNGNQTVTKTWNKERKHRFVALLKERLSSI
jgi:glycosyltransferase involved in cell wall biosynthesis